MKCDLKEFLSATYSQLYCNSVMKLSLQTELSVRIKGISSGKFGHLIIHTRQDTRTYTSKWTHGNFWSELCICLPFISTLNTEHCEHSGHVPWRVWQYCYFVLMLCIDFPGSPQRVNGKVRGRIFVGNSPVPVVFENTDLHSYVVMNQGRAYTAISTIPETLGYSLLPLASVGGIIGWMFAVEQHGYKNGFSITGNSWLK